MKEQDELRERAEKELQKSDKKINISGVESEFGVGSTFYFTIPIR